MKGIVSLGQLDIANGSFNYADYLIWKIEQAFEHNKGLCDTN
ncbi:MAG: hypothetical protein ACKVU2_00285 [Saprospiraceae bacterium]